MKRQGQSQPGFSSRLDGFLAVERNRWILLAIFGVGILCLLCVIAVIALPMVAPNLASISLFATPTVAPPPTPVCVQPGIAIGPAIFKVQSLPRAANNMVAVPTNAPDVAYWIEGTNSAFVFGLPAAPQNLALQGALKPGDRMKVVWADCSTEDYVVNSVEAGLSDPAALFDQTVPGIRVFVQNSDSSVSFVVHGVRPEIQAAETATPGSGETPGVQAQVEFLETKASEDGKTLTVSVAITNQGSAPIHLAAENISLGGENETPQAPLSVEPALPQEIAPGQRVEVKIMFNKPAAPVQVFKLLDFSVELYY